MSNLARIKSLLVDPTLPQKAYCHMNRPFTPETKKAVSFADDPNFWLASPVVLLDNAEWPGHRSFTAVIKKAVRNSDGPVVLVASLEGI